MQKCIPSFSVKEEHSVRFLIGNLNKWNVIDSDKIVEVRRHSWRGGVGYMCEPLCLFRLLLLACLLLVAGAFVVPVCVQMDLSMEIATCASSLGNVLEKQK